jgi:putative DNA primase/helicase
MSSAQELAARLGGAVRLRNGKGWLARCPCHEDRQASLSLRDGDTRLLVKCFAGCDVRDVLGELRRRGLLEDGRGHRDRPIARPPQSPIDPAKVEITSALRIWREAFDPRGTLAEKYLNGRGLELDDDLCGRVLRFHAGIKFGDGYRPALIAAFRPIVGDDDETAPPQAIHRIFLNGDGTKLAKKMLAPVGGAAVKLDADESVGEGLGICEGIETGLAVRATGWWPVWALGSAGAIAKLEPIAGISCLTIFGDHDSNGKGQAAAEECARRWAAAGHEVFIRIPSTTGADWLEAL